MKICGHRLLIVEAESLLRITMADALRNEGWVVDVAEDGGKGAALFEQPYVSEPGIGPIFELVSLAPTPVIQPVGLAGGKTGHADGKLVDKDGGDFRCAGRDDNGVKRPLVLPAVIPIANFRHNIVYAQPAKSFRRRLPEWLYDFDGVDLFCQPCQHRSLIS